MLYIGEKVGHASTPRTSTGRGRRAIDEVDIAVDPLEGTNLCATGARQRDRRARGVEQGRAAARAGSLHGEAGRRSELEGHVSLDAPVHENLKAIAGCLGRQRRGSRGHRARPRAPREADRGHPRDRRAHPADRRRRSVGRHRRRGRRLRRARGDGHRRRAGRRADGGRDALPERRDLRAPRRQQAGARGALPRDGHHRFQEGLSLEGSRAGQGHHLRGDRRHRRHADAGRPLLRRRHPHQLGDHAEQSAPDPVHRQHSRRARTPTSRSSSEGAASRCAACSSIPASPQRDAIQEAAKWIRSGGVVALPTDTLYGLAADPFSRRGRRARVRGEGARGRARAAADRGRRRAGRRRTSGALPPAGQRLAERFWPDR